MLNHISYIVRKIKNFTYENYTINGKLCNLSQEDISILLSLSDYVEEYTDLDGNDIIGNKLNDYINKDIKVQIDTGNIPGYFDTFSSFLAKNKIELMSSAFYIRDMDFLYKRDDSKRIRFYFQNIRIISTLRHTADYEHRVGNELDLFFHTPEKVIMLTFEYNENDITTNKLNKLEHLTTNPSVIQRKQFLANILINSHNSYGDLLNML